MHIYNPFFIKLDSAILIALKARETVLKIAEETSKAASFKTKKSKTKFEELNPNKNVSNEQLTLNNSKKTLKITEKATTPGNTTHNISTKSLKITGKAATSSTTKEHSTHGDNHKTQPNKIEIREQATQPKKTLKILKDLSSKMRAVLNDKPNEIIKNKSSKIEKTPPPAIVNEFLVTPIDMPAKPAGFNVQSVSSAGQTKKRKRSLEKIVEPKTQLDKPQWTSAGEFVVTKIPKLDLATYKPGTVSSVTDFIVTSLDKKSKKQQKTNQLPVEIVKQSAYNFKEKVLYGDRNKRETSKEMLQKKEKQKKYTYF